jgi:outer membrane lipoprotein-sorting protein
MKLSAAASIVFLAVIVPARAEAPAPGPTAGSSSLPAAAPRVVDYKAVIRGVNAWFNHATTMESDFVQLGPDGRRSQGRLYVERPGRLRFDYDPPSSLQIIADGRSVAVRDRRLRTQDEYFLSQTPLKFLLKQPFDLARDARLLEVEATPTNVAVRVEDSTTFGGTSRIRLVFDPKTYALQEWAVIDPQGYQTLVSLSNMKLGEALDPQLFVIPDRERD